MAVESRVQLVGEYRPVGTTDRLFVHAAANDVEEGLAITPQSREMAGAIHRLGSSRGRWVGSLDTLTGEVANGDSGWEFYVVSKADRPVRPGRELGRVLGFVSIRRADQQDGRALRIARLLFDHNLVNGHDETGQDDAKDALYLVAVGALLRTVVEARDAQDIVVADSDVSPRGLELLPRLGISVTRSDSSGSSAGLEGGRDDILAMTQFLGPNLVHRTKELAVQSTNMEQA